MLVRIGFVVGEVAERSKARAWRARMRQRIVGSNPTLSAVFVIPAQAGISAEF